MSGVPFWLLHLALDGFSHSTIRLALRTLQASCKKRTHLGNIAFYHQISTSLEWN